MSFLGRMSLCLCICDLPKQRSQELEIDFTERLLLNFKSFVQSRVRKIQPIAWFCTAHMLTVVFTFVELQGENKNNKTKDI